MMGNSTIGEGTDSFLGQTQGNPPWYAVIPLMSNQLRICSGGAKWAWIRCPDGLERTGTVFRKEPRAWNPDSPIYTCIPSTACWTACAHWIGVNNTAAR